MLVKKINPEWQPSENRGLKVGETIEITDARNIIVSGLAVGVDESTGAELTAFDLYGVIIESELDEFKAYQAMKKQEVLKANLESEKAKLEAQLNEVKATPEATAQTDVSNLGWTELVALGRDKGIYKVGMKKDELVAALKD